MSMTLETDQQVAEGVRNDDLSPVAPAIGTETATADATATKEVASASAESAVAEDCEQQPQAEIEGSANKIGAKLESQQSSGPILVTSVPQLLSPSPRGVAVPTSWRVISSADIKEGEVLGFMCSTVLAHLRAERHCTAICRQRLMYLSVACRWSQRLQRR